MQTPLLVVVGRTASGKDTFVDKIKTDERTMAISHTTRPKRDGEDGTHIFIDSIDGYSDRVLETTVNGYHYFLTRDDLEKHDIILVDPQGVWDLIELEGFDRPFKIIYLEIDRKIRQKRYLARDKVTLADFIKRDMSENAQFTNFESYISFPESQKKNNIKILSNDEDIEDFINRLNGEK